MATTKCNGRVSQELGARILIEKARCGFQEEQRENRRFPFFQPVTIDPEQDRMGSISAFSRDISAWGIGLFLNTPLKLKPVKLRIHFGETEDTYISGIVRWCQSCGQGWYLAGISFNNGDCDDLGYLVGGFTS